MYLVGRDLVLPLTSAYAWSEGILFSLLPRHRPGAGFLYLENQEGLTRVSATSSIEAYYAYQDYEYWIDMTEVLV